MLAFDHKKSLISAVLTTTALSLVIYSQGLAKDQSPQQEELKHACLEKKHLASCFAVLKSNRYKPENALPYNEIICFSGTFEAACIELGRYMESKKNWNQAIRYYRLGCFAQNSGGDACLAIAELAQKTKQLKSQAIWLKRACQKGKKEACNKHK